MSKRILDGGFNLTVYDINKEAAAPLLEKGAKWSGTPRDLAKSCEVVVSCLPTPQVVEQVVYGQNGLREGWTKGKVYVDMSTNSPTLLRQIAQDAGSLGVAVLDAPVSGGISGADTGNLTIMVGGDAATLEKVRKVLETMGKLIFHVGTVGCGNVAKLINNTISLTCGAINAESFVLGVKAGIAPQMLWEIICNSTGNNWRLRQYPESVFRGNFEPGFKLSLGCKDIGLAMQLGRDCGVPLRVAAAVEQNMIEAKAAGLGDKHTDAVILPLEKLTGVEVRSTQR
jgi:3-hydroxyisobutyrate dehydrogenase-like beta-hydroxyacid dehydrogenase